jgi:hypothetical protein
LIECPNPDRVAALPELLDLWPDSPRKVFNRWNTGFVQTNESPIVGSELCIKRLRALGLRGLTGNGTVLTIQDTGFDFGGPFLEDPLVPVGEGVVNGDHRKVSLFSQWSANGHRGHGTAAAAAAVGSAVCENSLNLYDGIAPDARLHAVAIGTADGDVWPMPATLLAVEMDRVGACVCVNAWGSGDRGAAFVIWDLLAESAPDKLFVFAAGNDGRVTDEGSGRNVLTVGALAPHGGQLLESGRSYVVIADGVQHEAELWSGGADLFRSAVVIENETITTVPIIECVLFATQQLDLCGATALAALVTFEPSFCEDRLSFPVLRVNADLSHAHSVSVVFVGAGTDPPEPAAWSGVGPGVGAAVKPDVVAPGSAVISAGSAQTDPDSGCANVSASLTITSGTSLAAATVGGAALLVRQYFADGFYPGGARFVPSANLVRAMIVAGAAPIGGSRTPSRTAGHGAVDLGRVLRFDGRLRAVTFSIGTREHFVWSVMMSDSSEPLRVAIAYLDTTLGRSRPGVVSDVDLFVELPNGSIVYGNMRPGAREERFATVERSMLGLMRYTSSQHPRSTSPS